ncbi:hypothetical protein [Kitasatospora sp. NPDC004289]
MHDEKEAETKRALGISSWRNLSKEKVLKFAAMVPDTSNEVRLKLLEQFPAFKDLAVNSVDALKKAHRTTVAANENNQERLHEASEQFRDILAEELKRDDLGPEDRQAIYDRLQQGVQQEYEKDSENKQFLERTIRLVTTGAVTVIALGAVFAGAQIMGESKDGHED